MSRLSSRASVGEIGLSRIPEKERQEKSDDLGTFAETLYNVKLANRDYEAALKGIRKFTKLGRRIGSRRDLQTAGCSRRGIYLHGRRTRLQ
jgi:hypothetical protein